MDEPANSGIFIRCADPASVNDRNSYEVNIYDTRADQTYRTGGIAHIAAPASHVDSPGRWNTYEIVAEGPRLRVWLNGEQMVDVEDSHFASGPIALRREPRRVRGRFRPRDLLRLVHRLPDPGARAVAALLAEHLDDFEEFARHVERWLADPSNA